jgi:hypothetical protein
MNRKVFETEEQKGNKKRLPKVVKLSPPVENSPPGFMVINLLSYSYGNWLVHAYPDAYHDRVHS